MKSMKHLFGSLFSQPQKGRPEAEPAAPVQRDALRQQAAEFYKKGTALAAIGRHEDELACYDQALAIDPRLALAWNNKGLALAALGRREEALRCYDQALAIDPRLALAWFNKARLEEALGQRREAALSYRKFIELAPPQYAQQIARARQRLVELEKR